MMRGSSGCWGAGGALEFSDEVPVQMPAQQRYSQPKTGCNARGTRLHTDSTVQPLRPMVSTHGSLKSGGFPRFFV